MKWTPRRSPICKSIADNPHVDSIPCASICQTLTAYSQRQKARHHPAFCVTPIAAQTERVTFTWQSGFPRIQLRGSYSNSPRMRTRGLLLDSLVLSKSCSNNAREFDVIVVRLDFVNSVRSRAPEAEVSVLQYVRQEFPVARSSQWTRGILWPTDGYFLRMGTPI